MNQGYLKNGQLCQVIEQTENGYYVRPVFFIEDEYGVEIEIEQGIELVEDVFEFPPVEKFHESITKLSQELNDLCAKRDLIVAHMRDLDAEVRQLENKKGEVSRGFVDLNLIKAKDWKIQVLFRRDSFTPKIIDREKMDVQNIESISIQQSIDRYGKMRAWFTLSDSRDSMYNYSHQLDLGWGIQHDPDMEKVKEFAFSKFKKDPERYMKMKAHFLMKNTQWIPQEYLSKVTAKAANEEKVKQRQLQDEIERKTKELSALKNKIQ